MPAQYYDRIASTHEGEVKTIPCSYSMVAPVLQASIHHVASVQILILALAIVPRFVAPATTKLHFQPLNEIHLNKVLGLVTLV